MTNPTPPPRPAATVVIMREQAFAPPELLLMERSRGMTFAAGALVFPGGAVDEADFLVAERFAGALAVDEGAARVAAIRETMEESGLAIGFQRLPDPEVIRELRARMHGGETFLRLLDAFDLELDLDTLVPFARWEPNLREMAKRLYDTRFYLARMPDDSHEPTVDETENVRLLWSSAGEALDRAGRGEARIIFPTRRNLERLAQFENFEAAARHARAIAIEKITPWIEDRDGAQHLCIPGHLGYPVTSELVETAMRT